MPRGGSRAGAGRKPNPKNGGGGGNVVDFPGGGAQASTEEALSLLEPPADIVAALKVAEEIATTNAGSTDSARVAATLKARADTWRRYAPLAIDQGTLVAFTVPGFRELCEQLALKDELAAKIARFGIEGDTGRARYKDYMRIVQRVDASLARFKLTAFGKPDESAGGAAQKAPTNPWAQAQ